MVNITLTEEECGDLVLVLIILDQVLKNRINQLEGDERQSVEKVLERVEKLYNIVRQKDS